MRSHADKPPVRGLGLPTLVARAERLSPMFGWLMFGWLWPGRGRAPANSGSTDINRTGINSTDIDRANWNCDDVAQVFHR